MTKRKTVCTKNLMYFSAVGNGKKKTIELHTYVQVATSTVSMAGKIQYLMWTGNIGIRKVYSKVLINYVCTDVMP